MQSGAVEHRGGGPGRRVDDTGRLWPFYFAVAVQIIAGAWALGTYTNTINRVSAQLDRALIIEQAQGLAIAALNCKTGITCRVAAGDNP